MGYGFSDYAMKEYEGRPDTSIHWMSPEDYLGLSPEFKEKPFESASGRSLMRSFQRGDHIESIPTLDVNVDGDTATVTDQDGRHRALLAQQEGVKEIPVAVRGIGENNPTQIAGMRGDKRPLELPQRQARQEAPQQQKEPISLLREIGNAIVPGAQAAEPGLPEGFSMSRPAAAPQDLPDGFTMSQGGGQPTEPAQAATPQKPVAQMSQEEAQAEPVASAATGMDRRSEQRARGGWPRCRRRSWCRPVCGWRRSRCGGRCAVRWLWRHPRSCTRCGRCHARSVGFWPGG